MDGLESVWLEHPDLASDPDAIFRSTLEQAADNLNFASALSADANLEPYQYATQSYIEDKLGWTPWRGTPEHPGQVEVIEAYELALRQMHERDAFEHGQIEVKDLQYWKPGQVIQNEIRVEAGHTVGKTKLSSGLVNHFFDCFTPSIIYCFAPSEQQIHDLLFKEIKTDRDNKGLPGKINDLELVVSANHFCKGRATSDNGGNGTERVQGQHGKYLMFVLDEAEGIPGFVWNAIKSMASGGIAIILMLANPKTRSSAFHKAKNRSTVKSFRISCTHHPNVLSGREVVPGAVRRQYVEGMIEGDGDTGNCEVLTEHDPDEHTFELPFPVVVKGQEFPPGTIFKPNAEFMFRVLGIPPANLADDTFIPVGRYEAACKRTRAEAKARDPLKIHMGVDVSRYGKDYGTLYIRHDGAVWRAAQFWKKDSTKYSGTIKEQALALWAAAPAEAKPNSLHIRVDGSGGWGSGVIDALKNDPVLKAKFKDFKVLEVQFGSNPHNTQTYYYQVCQMYGEAAESIKGLAILNPPQVLEADLCERTFEWANREGNSVKRITPKEKFKKLHKRSPDDGDGFVLCVCPDHIFRSGWIDDDALLTWINGEAK